MVKALERLRFWPGRLGDWFDGRVAAGRTADVFCKQVRSAVARSKQRGRVAIVSTDHLRGKSISRIRRIYFVSQGTVDTRAGALELCFQDGSSLLLDTHSDWTLHIKQGEWSDPFPPPLSAENAAFIRTHGKWAAFDLSTMLPSCLYIGRRVSAFREVLSDESGVPESLGIILDFDELAVKASSFGGEIRVEWTGPGGSFCDFPTTLAPE